ncbi:MAG: DUF1684 domain-containing protein [Flavobacteriales bacterium]
MRLLVSGSAVVLACCAFGQSDAWSEDLDAYWAGIEAEFRDSTHSPLLPEDRLHFTRLERFDPDEDYRVRARFKAKAGKEFGMRTTTERMPVYRRVGVLTFRLKGRKHTLSVYRNKVLTEDPAYSDHLFVPFTDLTNGVTTYGGGRYLDLKAPLGAEVELDFNRAYAPYCAYGGRYSCPIPPAENHLNAAIEAGVKAYDH